MNPRGTRRIGLLPAALCLLALALAPHAVRAQAPASEAPPPGDVVPMQGIRLQVFAQQPDGSFATDVTFKLLAEKDVFVATRKWSEVMLGLATAPSEWPVSDPASAMPAMLGMLRSGVPFKVRILDGVGRVVGAMVCDPLQSGELRKVTVPIAARRMLTVRVLDRDDRPVPGASIDLYDADRDPRDMDDVDQLAAWVDRKELSGVTSEGGDWEVGIPLAPGPLRLNVWATGFVGVPLLLDEVPADGAPFVVRLARKSGVAARSSTPATATAAADATGTLHLFALAPDGARATGVRFDVLADAPLFTVDSTYWDSLNSSDALKEWERRRTSDLQSDDVPIEFVDVLPDVRFTVRAFDQFWRELGRVECPPLTPGELRVVEIPALSARSLTIRVLDADTRPVAGAEIVARPPSSTRLGAWFANEITGTTNERGEFTAPGLLESGALEIFVSRSGCLELVHEVEALPLSGEPVVLQVASMTPMRIRVVDAQGHPVPVAFVSVFDADGMERVASPAEGHAHQDYYAQFVAAEWRVDAVPPGVRRVRATLEWGESTTITASVSDVTVVLPTHLVLTVTWDAAIASAPGEPRLLRIPGDTIAAHMITDEERAQGSALLTVPLGKWTLQLIGEQASSVIELPIEVSEDGETRVAFRAP